MVIRIDIRVAMPYDEAQMLSLFNTHGKWRLQTLGKYK